MSYPSDVLLPSNVKFIGFTEPKFNYNPHWDITWSFSYALTGSEHGICTYLTENTSLLSAIPGQYMGFLTNSPIPNGILAIALDSTGFFALSNTYNSGVGRSSVIKNSLIIRDGSKVLYNKALSSLSSEFNLSYPTKTWQTLRFRYANAGKKISIDYLSHDNYKNLVSLSLSSVNVDDYSALYPSFTFCSPISSNSISPSKLFLKNFHVQGCETAPTYETIVVPPLSSLASTTYTTISGIL